MSANSLAKNFIPCKSNNSPIISNLQSICYCFNFHDHKVPLALKIHGWAYNSTLYLVGLGEGVLLTIIGLIIIIIIIIIIITLLTLLTFLINLKDENWYSNYRTCLLPRIKDSCKKFAVAVEVSVNNQSSINCL